MPFPGGTYLQFITGYIHDEFQALYAQFEGYLRKEHKEDGSHAAITGDSLTVTGAVSADGAGTFGGNLTAQDGTDAEAELGSLDLLGGGQPIEYGLLIGGRTEGWVLQARPSGSPGSTGNEVRLWDLSHPSLSVLRVVYDTGNSRHLLGVELGATLAIGEDSASRRIAEINANTVRAVDVFSVGAALSAPQITADQNNYNPTGFLTSPTVFIQSDAARTITGFAAGTAGQRIWLINLGAFAITLAHNSGSSTAGNRIACPSGVNFALGVLESVEIEAQTHPTDSGIGWFVKQAQV